MVKGTLRRQLTGVIAVLFLVGLFFVAKLPEPSEAAVDKAAASFKFDPMSIAMPSGYTQQTIREVNQQYTHIDAWISSVGAAIAMNDLDGDGLSNDMCITDPRIDQVVVTPTPGAGEDRYKPFALTSGDLPMSDVMAPMGCTPGDFNEDGRMDLLVYLWGRTPIVHLANPDADGLTQQSYTAAELVPSRAGAGTEYEGPQWNTNAVGVDDFDGDGHTDIYIGNYFPDGPVLDPSKDGNVAMNESMSTGHNGGKDVIFRFDHTTPAPAAGAPQDVAWEQVNDFLPPEASRGWDLGVTPADLDGDHLPEVYLSHDFGQDRLLHNTSSPGTIRFSIVEGSRGPFDPKSKVVGHDSFKGMGSDTGDLDGDGLMDMFVSNITTSFGIQESNFAWMNDTDSLEETRAALSQGEAPFTDRSAAQNTAWSGWGWDVKMGDFDNSGNLAIAQATGFVKGQINRWPQLQELATANDDLLMHPVWWPNVRAHDDVGGNQGMKFFAKTDEGKYADLAPALGMSIPVPTRGVATGDSDGDGRLDLAMARQWDAPVFYHNTGEMAAMCDFVGLRLTHEQPAVAGSMPAPGSPAIGATATVTLPDGSKRVGKVDGGGGHSGKRSSEIHIGLGAEDVQQVEVKLSWRDRSGELQTQDMKLSPGWHDIQLGTQAKEK